MAFYTDATGDWLVNILNLLVDGWLKANTDDTTPQIRLITDSTLPKQIDCRNTDYILLYEEGSSENHADVGYSGEYGEMNVAVDIRTNKGRSRANLLLAEVKRVILANRCNPVDSDGTSLGMNVLIWRGGTDLSNRMYRLWRFVCKVDAINYYQKIT